MCYIGMQVEIFEKYTLIPKSMVIEESLNYKFYIKTLG
jgi:hypothetical protein